MVDIDFIARFEQARGVAASDGNPAPIADDMLQGYRNLDANWADRLPEFDQPELAALVKNAGGGFQPVAAYELFVTKVGVNSDL